MKIIGVMTGNSMDACDVVLTSFQNEKMEDLASFTLAFSDDMRKKIDFLRYLIVQEKISMVDLKNLPAFQQIHDEYIHLVASCILTLIEKSGFSRSDIEAIGFHGKTLDHCPRSVALKRGERPYTCQMGSGQMLADLVGIPVIYDFRSDDVMNGGDGAPLAPPHNGHLAQSLGIQDAIFYNAGNTSNISVISKGTVIQGWDAGPFNEFPDYLMRTYQNEMCDWDGKEGKKGKLIKELIQTLFYNTSLMPDGSNFYLMPPPRSGDPAYYRFPADILEGHKNSFSDIIRTVEFFSAYLAAYTLKFISQDIHIPTDFILFGGGWHNPVSRKDFEHLLTGKGFVLPEHQTDFEKIRSRFTQKPNLVVSSLGKYMEARIFADLAKHFLLKKEWFETTLTGSLSTCVLGRISYPNQGKIDDQINRASKGWQEGEK